jgi:hypothetical protein
MTFASHSPRRCHSIRFDRPGLGWAEVLRDDMQCAVPTSPISTGMSPAAKWRRLYGSRFSDTSSHYGHHNPVTNPEPIDRDTHQDPFPGK